MSDGVEIRALRDGDDLEAQRDLAERAFGPRSASQHATWLKLMELVVANGTAQAAFADGRAAGTALFFDMRQWWYGRAVPMAGVSGVKVAPELRGHGIGKRLMTALLDDIAARGYPLSVLYPATRPIYRQLGWEAAGCLYTGEIPAHGLRSLAPPDLACAEPRPVVRRATAADAGTINDIIGRVHQAARDCGPLTWDNAALEIKLGASGGYTYLCEDGITWFDWHDGNDAIIVRGVSAASAAAARELWAVIASNGSIADTVRFGTHPGDPIWQLTAERDVQIRSVWGWMLRVVDAPGAIAARGFPSGLIAHVPLRIADRHRPANTGDWMLSVEDGKGVLERAEFQGAVLRLGPRGLAALYAGTPVSTLRISGLADGGDLGDDAALDAAFRATPYLLDAF